MKVRTKRDKVVLVFHSSNRSSWHETLAGIARHANKEGWRLQPLEHVTTRKNIVELLDFWHPDGIIAECGVDEQGLFVPDAFGKVPTVYLVCDTTRLKPNSLRVNHDSASVGWLAARELLVEGMRSFGYFGVEGLFWSEERGRYFAEALSMNGYECETFLRRLDEGTAKGGMAGSRQRLAEWLKSLPKPCGLLAANDMLALDAINVCAEAGVKVPEDVSILGIDNDEVACENVRPTLSSIKPNFEEAGHMAAELLDMRLGSKGSLRSERQRLFPAGGIVHRASTMRLKRSDKSVAKALEMIRTRACDGLQPKDVFAVLPESRRTIEKRFQELRGCSLLDEICAVRMARVKELLSRREVAIETIAARCGWRSTARLRVLFREVEGISMSEWRDRNVE